MPVRQAVEIAHARPDAVIAGVDDGGHVDPSHGALRSFLAWTALGRCFAAGRGRRRRGRLALASLARGLADTLHVARLADQSWHPGEAAAFDTDVGEDRVN